MIFSCVEHQLGLRGQLSGEPEVLRRKKTYMLCSRCFVHTVMLHRPGYVESVLYRKT